MKRTDILTYVQLILIATITFDTFLMDIWHRLEAIATDGETSFTNPSPRCQHCVLFGSNLFR